MLVSMLTTLAAAVQLRGGRIQLNRHHSIQASNVGITNFEGLQFFGDVFIGTPPQRVTMVFDTGSGELVVRGRSCNDCQGEGGYSQALSSTSSSGSRNYGTTYGSGVSRGKCVYDTVRVGAYSAKVLIAVADSETDRFAGFKFDGIFGLSM
jgi:hypothetical protein